MGGGEGGGESTDYRCQVNRAIDLRCRVKYKEVGIEDEPQLQVLATWWTALPFTKEEMSGSRQVCREELHLRTYPA